MRYYLLAVLLGLASFSVPALLAALGISAAWPRLRSSIERQGSGPRGRVLVAMRAIPTIVGGVSVTAFTIAFLKHEPRQTTEAPGVLLVVAAAGAVLLGALIATRGLREAARSVWFGRLASHCRELKRADGTAICIVETSYPLAAVAGMFRPRLLMSSRILCECTPEELDAIVAHERAHIRARHNVVRAVMLALPDPLAVLRKGREIEAAWALAAEEAADDEATGLSETKRAALAAALLHVARMADAGPPSWMPALAFYQGQDLRHRVGALLDRPLRDGPSFRALHPTLLALAVAIIAWSNYSSDTLHRAVEWMVRSLP